MRAIYAFVTFQTSDRHGFGQFPGQRSTSPPGILSICNLAVRWTSEGSAMMQRSGPPDLRGVPYFASDRFI